MSKHCILKQIVWIFLQNKRPFRETYGVIRDYALNFHAKWLSRLRSHSLVTYSIGIFNFNIYGVEFYYGYNHTKIILRTEWFLRVLRYFFHSVIRDYALNFHAKWLSMLRSHSYVTYSLGIFYFNIYGVEFYYGYNHTKIILRTEWFLRVFALFLSQCNTRLRTQLPCEMAVYVEVSFIRYLFYRNFLF
jgi:hypothetical protein